MMSSINCLVCTSHDFVLTFQRMKYSYLEYFYIEKKTKLQITNLSMREQPVKCVITNWCKHICMYVYIHTKYRFPKTVPNYNETRASKVYKRYHPYRTYAKNF